MTVVANTPSNPVLANLLRNHPHVVLENQSSGEDIQFQQGNWRRYVTTGDATAEVFGLTELVDNNPMVCADKVSVPNPAATLGLVALGPLLKSGLLQEPPVLQTNALGETDAFWASMDWHEGVEVAHEPLNLGEAYAATGIALVDPASTRQTLLELYDECFGRSFYVRSDDASPWDTKLVAFSPRAVYRLSTVADAAGVLVTVQVMADRNGKCGAAQMVHAMNVMAGFEESLGIPESLFNQGLVS